MHMDHELTITIITYMTSVVNLHCTDHYNHWFNFHLNLDGIHNVIYTPLYVVVHITI